jgi:hypothetical protein
MSEPYRSHVLRMFTLVIIFMAMSNLPIFSWVLAPMTTKCTSLIMVLQGYTGTKRHISIFHTKKTATLLEPPHLPQSTIIWVWNSHIATTWNPSPIFSYTSFISLPWSSIKLAMDMEWHKATLQQKMGSPLDLLGFAYPNKFSVFLSYTRTLHFNEKPDYAYIRKIFHELFLRTEYQHATVQMLALQVLEQRTISGMFSRRRIWDAPMTGWLSLPPIACELHPRTHSCIPNSGTSDTAYLQADTFILLCALGV